MKNKNYLSVFARMSDDAKIFTLQRIGLRQDMAQELLQKLIDEIKQQETLLNLAHTKAYIDEKEMQLIDKIKLLRLKTQEKRRKEGKQERLIRLRYFYEIDKLHKQGLGFRKIAEYIRTYHKKKISHVTIQNAYNKIKNQLEQGQQE